MNLQLKTKRLTISENSIISDPSKQNISWSFQSFVLTKANERPLSAGGKPSTMVTAGETFKAIHLNKSKQILNDMAIIQFSRRNFLISSKPI